ncbi:tRNA uridine(34) 5-carboxymethylaminomethyl modification radical SAM/GNAT enzyme Elp3 [Candidatus Thorarchaeota archaeon]|nr:MAG: tRNA uridine(34) 5-carboxymethylaminomethyl modification radical SAM/GNAT enzyme Elp3 [Candidatus Thorarchaeota archaeon]
MTAKDNDYVVYREIVEALLQSHDQLTRRAVNRIKNKVCGKYNLPRTPSNADILQVAIPEEAEILRPFLQKRPVRTVSGVAVVATMTSPQDCPHGRCAYCPGGPELGVPQSYTGHEPATMRGLQHDFDPYRQVEGRLAQLKNIGHSINKVELIVMGGDWCSKPVEYQKGFVKGCLDAMNGSISENLHEAKTLNETAPVRNVGLTFETRPDWVTENSIDAMLEMGATRVEIGVQSLSDEILERVERGHGVEATVTATQMLRDSGLKVCYHMMPGLPGTTLERDLEDFSTLFSDPRFCPDMLKIYPTIVVKNTKLYGWWKSGSYAPHTTDETVSLLADAVSKMPEYVRIQRMQRDIPLHQIEAGLDKGHLRELVHQEMEKRSLRNPTIRYREIGHLSMRSDVDPDPSEIELIRRDYSASGGSEVFLSLETPKLDALFGFLRLRVPSENAPRKEISDEPCTLIRELRVYGPVVEVGDHDPEAWQHLGLGERLMREAYDVTKEELDRRRILVNSGIGVKEYYRNLGFRDAGPYMERELSD